MGDILTFIRNCRSREARGTELERDLKSRLGGRVVRLVSEGPASRNVELFSALNYVAADTSATYLFFVEDDMTYTERLEKSLSLLPELGYPFVQLSVPEAKYLYRPLDERTYLYRGEELHYSGAYFMTLDFLREFLASHFSGSEMFDGEHFDLLLTRFVRSKGLPIVLQPGIVATKKGIPSALGNTYEAQDPFFKHELSVI